MKTTRTFRSLSLALPAFIGATAIASSHDPVELSLLSDNSPNSVAVANALVAAYQERNPNVEISVEIRPGGSEGDNIVRTRLATGSMTDLFIYNSGSLMQALNPSRTLVDLSDEDFMERISPSYQSVVAQGEGVYGVPFEAGMGGGIFYNRGLYEELDLEVPTTWDAFMENNAIIDAQTDVAPVIGTFGETWTAQLFFLADFYNVQQQDPDFAEEFTAGNRQFANSEAALNSFRRIQEVHEAGYFNSDYESAGYEDGLRMLVEGEGAHYPMLTFAVSAMLDNFGEESVENIGFFAQPGDDGNGLTVWMPGSMYIANTSDHTDEAKDFLAFVASTEGCEAIVETIGAAGPFLIETCGLPDTVPQPVADMLVYFQDSDRNAPALEFLSPVKGPSLEQIMVEIGSGFRDAQSGAELYDRDVSRQARQLGLSGW
ncbi:ABC transporter substrate-binding protein [Saccharospirillum alexandrii]|uniref:ABC transporter substrate-binding protein n=1 Tax=Saccharospirillum alexandrii TaxID=2448477 RepID=UPI000FDA5BFF|nr:extracellular solute-binding protein [Saccharospirillum alexandrii]